MCGILGFAHAADVRGAPSRNARNAAISALAHRGPDAWGEYDGGPVWLAHARLSILDLSSAGAQPMRTPDGRHIISYNGEVYNYRELGRELGLRELRSHSDTEVVLRAFAERGLEVLARFNGMFAFAVYDGAAQRLWLVRDRLGIKPLYYAIDQRRLCFASEVAPLLRLVGGEATCELGTVHEWLYYGNALGGRTLVRGVEQLRPGHYLELDLRSFKHQVGAYWTITEQLRRPPPPASRADRVSRVRVLLEQAVRRQLVSDVPVGVFLSGGVDSSAITAFASRHYGARLTTYSAGFDDRSGVDERAKARRVAKLFGTDHHEFEVGSGDVAPAVETMIDHHGGPFFDAANVPLYRMASIVRASTKVVLQGDGGDEVFGGYRRYVSLRLYPLLRLVGRPLGAFASHAPASRLRQRAVRYLTAYGAGSVGATMGRLLTQEGAFDSPVDMFSRQIALEVANSDPLAWYRALQRQVAALDIGNQMSLVDLQIVLPDIYLEKVDRATMAASLEVRVPFLDHDLVDYAVTIPGPEKMPWGRKKWLLKQALAGVLPPDILNGPKTGFGVPFGYWLRTSLRAFFNDHLATFVREQPGVLRPEIIEGWYSQYYNGVHDHAERLWKVLNFLVWRNRFRVRIEPGSHAPEVAE